MKLLIAAAVLALPMAAHAQTRCTSPQDTRCSPSYWLAPAFNNTNWYSQNAFMRRAQIYDCSRPRVIHPQGCAAALRAEQQATGAPYGR